MIEKIKVAFQGEKGAYSHLASLEVFTNAEVKACSTFEETLGISIEDNSSAPNSVEDSILKKIQSK